MDQFKRLSTSNHGEVPETRLSFMKQLCVPKQGENVQFVCYQDTHRASSILIFSYFLTKFLFFLFFPIFQGNSYFSYLLAIFHLILLSFYYYFMLKHSLKFFSLASLDIKVCFGHIILQSPKVPPISHPHYNYKKVTNRQEGASC